MDSVFKSPADLLEQASRSRSVLVLGLGNPILGDDGVGWRIAAEIQAQAEKRAPTVEIDVASLGGLSLMERILGYGRVILVDAMQTGSVPEGTVSVCSLDDLPDPNSGHTASVHDTSLARALKTAEALGAAVPCKVHVVAIETKVCHDFSESLSEKIAATVPIATRKVFALLT
jgi:hydrogenase maturation protease